MAMGVTDRSLENTSRKVFRIKTTGGETNGFEDSTKLL
jgi:hypothetical protein